jgi:hypothetical protein
MNRDLSLSNGVLDTSQLLEALGPATCWSRQELQSVVPSCSSWGKRPGIYAFYGDEVAWTLIEEMSGTLPHGYVDLSRPIYVGIHNDIIGRLSEHLSFCRPDSTYRCSLIALTHQSETWKTIAPRFRTDVKPTDYRIAPKETEQLNEWISRHLRDSVVGFDEREMYGTCSLWERQLIAELLPPLNVQHSVAPTSLSLRRARALCAELAAVSPHMLRYINGEEAVLVPRRDIA